MYCIYSSLRREHISGIKDWCARKKSHEGQETDCIQPRIIVMLRVAIILTSITDKADKAGGGGGGDRDVTTS